MTMRHGRLGYPCIQHVEKVRFAVEVRLAIRCPQLASVEMQRQRWQLLP